MRTNKMNEMNEITQCRYNDLMKRTIDDLIWYVIGLEDELDDFSSTENENRLENMLESIKKIVMNTNMVTTPLQNTDVDLSSSCDVKDVLVSDSDSDDDCAGGDVDYAYEAGWEDGYCDALDKLDYNMCDERNERYAAGYEDGYSAGYSPYHTSRVRSSDDINKACD